MSDNYVISDIMVCFFLVFFLHYSGSLLQYDINCPELIMDTILIPFLHVDVKKLYNENKAFG